MVVAVLDQSQPQLYVTVVPISFVDVFVPHGVGEPCGMQVCNAV